MKTYIPLITALLLVAQASLPVTVHAASIPVTTTADSGPGSLREALASAAAGDTIDASGVSGAILLTSGELLVTNSLTIVGSGPNNLAVDGNAVDRVFHLGSNGVLVTIASLTVTNGSRPVDSGGGIWNDRGTLTISNCALSGNSGAAGGGIFNDCGEDSVSLEIVNCTFSGNSAENGGGGLWNNGEDGSANVKIVNSTFSGNSAFGNGGGLYNDGYGGVATMEIINSTLSGNSAGNFGGGGGGGGIFNDGAFDGKAILEIVNSTLSSNSATVGGGINNDAGALTVANCTLSGNSADDLGGGIYTANGALAFGNSIIALNSAATDPDIAGSFTGNFNFIGDTDGDPLLGPLQDNGGPTRTMALLPGSPCINIGDPAFAPPPEFDQRGTGFPRVGGGRIDIGAFEVQAVVVADSDGDGVADAIDECSDTPASAIVNATGCSIAQLVPCDGPRSGGKWKNHGQYVRSVVRTATSFLKAKLITRRQWTQIVTRAAWSKCGWNRRWDHDWDRDWHRDWDCGRDNDWGRDRD